MITENVQNLFSFIDFLHSKIEYLLSKQNIVDEFLEIKEKRDNLSLSNNYRDKLELRKIQELLNQKWKFVEQEVSKPITDKIDEFDVVTDRNLNHIKAKSELLNLQNNFEEEDLEAIFSAKEKYLEFRSKTNFHYFTGDFFIDNLDRTLKEFYEFFKDEDYNEFNKLQTNAVLLESLDEQGLEKAVRKLTGNSNKLHFETFPEFLNYFKNNFNDIEIDERHSEAKRLFEQNKLKLENSNFKSEIDEVKEFSEKAVKDFKNKLMLSFTNENYKTKFNGGMNPNLIAIGKLYFEYENLYNSAKNKSDIFNYLSTLSKEEIKERIQGAEALKRLCEISIDYSKDGNWSVGNLPIEFESITKVDLFVENFTKSIEILAKEGKDVHQLIDLLIQGTKTNLENPLLEKNAKIKSHLFNRLEGVKLLFQNVKDLPPQQKQESEPQISNVSNDIESAFSFMQQNDPRKHKRIISDDDFDSLMKWITYYFENNFTIPEIDNPIKVINTNKGNVVYTFIKIFKELHPTKTRPDSLFELIKLCFYDYRNDNISNYKKQKEPQFYSELINKK